MNLNDQATNVKLDRSLYVHIPFCRHRCGYCNFSLVANRDYLIDRFLNAIEIEASYISGRPTINTVFFGGGTPSHLNEKQLKRLTLFLKEKFAWSSAIEFSIECNPCDLDESKRDLLGQIGVNRISFGVQSFRSQKLALLERDHRLPEIENAFSLAQSITDNISLDLIFATPGESLDQWRDEIAKAKSLGPAHISIYELTIEKGTQFWNHQNAGKLVTPDEELRLEMYLNAIDELENCGYQHYEISSFSVENKKCLHNLAYWSGKDYFALGPGAASFVEGVRRVNHRSTNAYLSRIEKGVCWHTSEEHLSPIEKAIDFIIFGLRKIDGVSLEPLFQNAEFEMQERVSELLQKQQQLRLIQCEGNLCRLTKKGIILYDSVVQDWVNLL